MKPEIKKLWVDALRSGEYKQGYNALKPSNETYCCLGVLCDVHRKVTGEGDWRAVDAVSMNSNGAATCIGNYAYVSSDGKENEALDLPIIVKEWAELLSISVPFREDTECSLNAINDSKRYSFQKIAALIEASLI